MNTFGELGSSCIIFRDLGSTSKIILGSRGKYFRGAGEIWAAFSGSKEALTPLPPPRGPSSNLLANKPYSYLRYALNYG